MHASERERERERLFQSVQPKHCGLKSSCQTFNLFLSRTDAHAKSQSLKILIFVSCQTNHLISKETIFHSIWAFFGNCRKPHPSIRILTEAARAKEEKKAHRKKCQKRGNKGAMNSSLHQEKIQMLGMGKFLDFKLYKVKILLR